MTTQHPHGRNRDIYRTLTWPIILALAIIVIVAAGTKAYGEGGWECPPGTVLSWTEHPPSPFIDGDTYTAGDFRDWMTAAGLTDVTRTDLGPNKFVITAHKP